jgi:hypothetical protein
VAFGPKDEVVKPPTPQLVRQQPDRMQPPAAAAE